MGQSDSRKGQFGHLQTAQTVAERVNSFLRGAYPRDTAKQVARATGVPAPTVAKWLSRTSAPSASALLACCVAFGPTFLSAVCPGLAWVEIAVGVTRREALERARARAEVELAVAVDRLRGHR